MLSFGKDDHTRPEYHLDPETKKKQSGFHYEGGFIDIDPEQFPAAHSQPNFPKEITNRRVRIGYLITLLLMFTVAATVVGILGLKLYLQVCIDLAANPIGKLSAHML